MTTSYRRAVMLATFALSASFLAYDLSVGTSRAQLQEELMTPPRPVAPSVVAVPPSPRMPVTSTIAPVYAPATPIPPSQVPSFVNRPAYVALPQQPMVERSNWDDIPRYRLATPYTPAQPQFTAEQRQHIQATIRYRGAYLARSNAPSAPASSAPVTQEMPKMDADEKKSGILPDWEDSVVVPSR